jgi:hypothetical protein
MNSLRRRSETRTNFSSSNSPQDLRMACKFQRNSKTRTIGTHRARGIHHQTACLKQLQASHSNLKLQRMERHAVAGSPFGPNAWIFAQSTIAYAKFTKLFRNQRLRAKFIEPVQGTSHNTRSKYPSLSSVLFVILGNSWPW